MVCPRSSGNTSLNLSIHAADGAAELGLLLRNIVIQVLGK
jgi:hypothetical protein